MADDFRILKIDCDSEARPLVAKNIINNKDLFFWLGNNLSIGVTCFVNGSLYNFANTQKLILGIKPCELSGEPLDVDTFDILCECSASGINKALTDEQHAQGGVHATFKILPENISKTMTAGVKWCIVQAVDTSDGVYTFFAGNIYCKNDASDGVASGEALSRITPFLNKVQNISASAGKTSIKGEVEVDTIKGGIESNVLLGEGYTIQKGWYYNWIDKNNLGTWNNVVAGTSRVDFYLTTEQSLTPAEAKPAVDTSFVSGWAVNDIISIVDNDICVDSAKITAISGNKITVALIGSSAVSKQEQDSYWLWYSINNNTNGWRPLGSSTPTKNDYSLYVTAKPNVGGAEISGNIFNLGSNTANGACSATMIGNGNRSKRDNTLTVGKGLINNNNYSTVVGEYNKASEVRYRPFTVGCGDGESNRVNALEVDRVLSTEGKSVGGKITSYIGNFVNKLLVAGVDISREITKLWYYVNTKLTKENNLSDVANKATARTNLEVYSKSETDTKLSDKQDKVPIEYSNRLMRTSAQWKMTPFRSSRINNTAVELHTDTGAVSKTYTKYSPTNVQVFTEVDSAAKEMTTVDSEGFKAKARTTSSGANLGASYLYYASRQSNAGTGEYTQTTAGEFAMGKTGVSITPLTIIPNVSSSLGITYGVRIRNSDGAGAYVTLSGEFGYCVTNTGITQPLYYFKTDGKIYSKDIITESGFGASQTFNEPFHGAHPCVMLPNAQGGTFNIWKGTQAEYDALTKKYNNYIYFVVQTDNSVKMHQGTDTLGS